MRPTVTIGVNDGKHLKNNWDKFLLSLIFGFFIAH